MKNTRIWSGEQKAFWLPGGIGYTNQIIEAGVWTKEDAQMLTKNCGPEEKIKLRESSQFERVCVHCGCRDNDPCEDGCHWVEVHEATPTGVCSQCATTGEALKAALEEAKYDESLDATIAEAEAAGSLRSLPPLRNQSPRVK